MVLIVRMTASRWLGSASSKSKRIFEIRSEPVWVEQATMFTWWSEMAFDTSRSSFDRSRAFTSIEAMNMSSPASPSHSTSIMRAVWAAASETALAQSARCTLTPRPRVMKPMISSPGTGVQQRESRTITSSRPSTWTPTGPLALALAPGRARP